MSGYVKFTGEWNKLLGMGFTYPKVHDGGRVRYDKCELSIYRRGSEVYLSSIHIFKFLLYLKQNPITQIIDDTVYVYQLSIDDNYRYFPVNDHYRDIATNITHAYVKALKDEDQTPTRLYMDTQWLKTDTLQVLKELRALNWLELVEHD